MDMRAAPDFILQPLSTQNGTTRRAPIHTHIHRTWKRSGSVELLRFCRCRVGLIVVCSGNSVLRLVNVVENSVVLYDDRTDGTDV